MEIEAKAASDRLGDGMFEQYADSALTQRAFEPEPDAVELRLGGDQLDIDAHDLELGGHHRLLELLAALLEEIVDFDFRACLHSQ